MSRRFEETPVRTIGILAGGTIGASWAAYFLARGYDVLLCEPNLPADAVSATVERTWPALTALGLAPTADPARMTVLSHIDARFEKVDFVQECVPEDLALKHRVLNVLEQHIREDVVIASSTSSLLASDIQAGCQRPNRLLVGHPFNPPHLLPVVEVAGGRQTAPWAIKFAVDFYRAAGRVPVVVKKEAVGHIGNRLTAALYREAINIVVEGIGTVEDVDTVIANGPGLRWALIGPHLSYHLSGGQGGIRHYLSHLGAAQEARWQTLGDPHLTDEVRQALVDGVMEEAGDRSIDELEEWRDAMLVRLRQARE